MSLPTIMKLSDKPIASTDVDAVSMDDNNTMPCPIYHHSVLSSSSLASDAMLLTPGTPSGCCRFDECSINSGSDGSRLILSPDIKSSCCSASSSSTPCRRCGHRRCFAGRSGATLPTFSGRSDGCRSAIASSLRRLVGLTSRTSVATSECWKRCRLRCPLGTSVAAHAARRTSGRTVAALVATFLVGLVVGCGLFLFLTAMAGTGRRRSSVSPWLLETALSSNDVNSRLNDFGNRAAGGRYDGAGGSRNELTTLLLLLTSTINQTRIKENLRAYSTHVHITGTHSNSKLHNILRQQMSLLASIDVSEATYEVLASYPDWERPNTVQVLDDNDSIIFESGYRGPAVEGDPRPADHPEVTEPYIAFSPNGVAKGRLVYVRYGESSDFDQLQAANVSVVGAVVLVRFSFKANLPEVVHEATKRGAVGVVVFADIEEDVDRRRRQDCASFVPDNRDDDGLRQQLAYPDGPRVPGWTAIHGTLLQHGDPTTPGRPSKPGLAIPLSLVDVNLPRVPVHTVSHDDGVQLMRFVDGLHDFASNTLSLQPLNHTVNCSSSDSLPVHNNNEERGGKREARISVFNELERRNITNLFGTIHGREEPDRYVIVGCHYDSWSYGAVGPSSGTALLFELMASFNHLVTYTEWRPRRTLMFVLWDAGEMALAGVTEWIEEHMTELNDRLVTYVSLDDAVSGSDSLEVHLSPVVSQLMRDVVGHRPTTQPPPDSSTDRVTDSVGNLSTDRTSDKPTGNFRTRIADFSDDVILTTDSAPFITDIGVPVIWPRFTSQANLNERTRRQQTTVHRTSVDNFDYMERFIEKDKFQIHGKLARIVAAILLPIVTSVRLPFDIRETGARLEQLLTGIQLSHNTQAFDEEIVRLLEYLQQAIYNFSQTAAVFHSKFVEIDERDEMTLRQYNDRQMKTSTVFARQAVVYHDDDDVGKNQSSLCVQSASPPTHFRNILLTGNHQRGVAFTGIQRALDDVASTKSDIKRHLAAIERSKREIVNIINNVHSAETLLKDG